MKKLPVKTQIKICVAFVWAGAVISLLSQTFGQWLLWLGIGVTAVAAICRYTLVRCPHCGHPIGDSQGAPFKCSRCGGSLE